MNRTYFFRRFSSEKFSRGVRHVGVASVLFCIASGFAAGAVPDAPTVAPAPIVDKPLAPAANDVPGDQPTPQHVWVPGHWRWNEGAYVWESGRWEVPPAPNVAWTPPQWQLQGNGYVLKEGFWDEAPPAPAAAPVATQEIAVAEPPPPPQREVIYERPAPTYVWVPGFWSWQNGRHVWIAGHWELPPRANVMWVPARWELRGNRYVLLPGYWRETAVVAAPPPPAPQVVVAPPAPAPQVVVMAPPPPRHEVVYARPSPYHVWVPGYWAWRGGRHVWIAGHYDLPPRGYRTWVEPRWERRGGSYIMIEGHWGR